VVVERSVLTEIKEDVLFVCFVCLLLKI